MRLMMLASVIAMLLLACEQEKKIDLNLEEANILALHHLQRDYHFNKDSTALIDQLSDNFISINRGEVTKPTKQEMISRFHQYFSSVEFVRWDDISEPVLRFSEDGKMAYTIVEKIVQTNPIDEQTEPEGRGTRFAWTTVYRKYGEVWKIDCITSTNTP